MKAKFSPQCPDGQCLNLQVQWVDVGRSLSVDNIKLCKPGMCAALSCVTEVWDVLFVGSREAVQGQFGGSGCQCRGPDFTWFLMLFRACLCWQES